ncbi:DNA-binding protein [Aquipuribacter hungaricus]|uniref:DNA-binding protein n=1 Tax=Aquipuribacter hungaricus TaxID=545624 RepID=A0ABV7WFC2_9MICO
MEAPARTLEQQRDWYGAPLAEVFEDLCTSLQVTQAALARLLGLSPAMVSQLRNGQRAKIGNPAAAHRLAQLMDLAGEVRAGSSTPAEALAQAETVRADTTAFARSGGAGPGDDELVRAGLARLASAPVLRRLADAAEAEAPDLARVLRAAAGA